MVAGRNSASAAIAGSFLVGRQSGGMPPLITYMGSKVNFYLGELTLPTQCGWQPVETADVQHSKRPYIQR